MFFSYFNREISEEEKKLLGDFTPKQISVSSNSNLGTADGSNTLVNKNTTGSVWNTGGTWEEKIYTPW